MLAVLSGPLACETAPPAVRTEVTADPGDAVLARVNGVEIRDSDVLLALEASAHGAPEVTDTRRRNVLTRLIGEELRAQEARRLGLDGVAAVQEALRSLRARVRAAERELLSQRLLTEARKASLRVTDDELRAWYDANQVRIQTLHHVRQILRRSPEAAAQARVALDAGRSFDEVAAENFPSLPPNRAVPWDLGPLRWSQVPTSWWPALDALEPGQTSGVIAGPRDRYWIIELVERRVDPDLTLENLAQVLRAELQKERKLELRSTLDAELRERAEIERLDGASPG